MDCISYPVLRCSNVSGKGWAVQDSPAPFCFLLNTHPPISAPLACTGRLIPNRSANKSDSLPELGSPGRGRFFWGKGPELLHLGQREGSRHCPVSTVRQCPPKRRQGEQSQGRGLIVHKQPVCMGQVMFPVMIIPGKGAAKATERHVSSQMGRPPSLAIAKRVP